nr:hypothetical protein CFP56_37230 [Quercus suber]
MIKVSSRSARLVIADQRMRSESRDWASCGDDTSDISLGLWRSDDDNKMSIVQYREHLEIKWVPQGRPVLWTVSHLSRVHFVHIRRRHIVAEKSSTCVPIMERTVAQRRRRPGTDESLRRGIVVTLSLPQPSKTEQSTGGTDMVELDGGTSANGRDAKETNVQCQYRLMMTMPRGFLCSDGLRCADNAFLSSLRQFTGPERRRSADRSQIRTPRSEEEVFARRPESRLARAFKVHSRLIITICSTLRDSTDHWTELWTGIGPFSSSPILSPSSLVSSINHPSIHPLIDSPIRSPSIFRGPIPSLRLLAGSISPFQRTLRPAGRCAHDEGAITRHKGLWGLHPNQVPQPLGPQADTPLGARPPDGGATALPFRQPLQFLQELTLGQTGRSVSAQDMADLEGGPVRLRDQELGCGQDVGGQEPCPSLRGPDRPK